MRKGVFLRFYMHEGHRHHHQLLHQWMLQEAKKIGIHGGTVFRAVAGFGHHGTLHFQHFYELAGDLTMQIDFLVTEPEAERLLAIIKREGVRILYMKVPVTFGVVNPDSDDEPELSADITADDAPGGGR
jgi:PII-like signaling protein